MGTLLFPQTDSNDDAGVKPDVESAEDGAPAPSESSTENQPGAGQDANGAGGEEGKKKGAGFADDPRWQEREENWKTRFNDQEKRHAEEIAKIHQRFETINPQKPAAPQGQQQPAEETEIPDWFNGDQESWNKYQEHEEQRIQKILEARQSKETEQKASQDRLVQEATQYFNDQLAEIEGDTTLNPDGVKFDQNMKNKLLKIAEEHDLVDSKMRWNWKAAWRVLKATSPAPSSQSDTDTKKKVAAASTAKSGAESSPSKVTGSSFFKKTANRPW